MTTNEELPYIITERTVIERKYNPNYGADRICQCGHLYYRHFDTYADMYPCGCKYCPCFEFKEDDGTLKKYHFHRYNMVTDVVIPTPFFIAEASNPVKAAEMMTQQTFLTEQFTEEEFYKIRTENGEEIY